MIILVEIYKGANTEKVAIDYGNNLPNNIKKDLDNYLYQEFPNMDTYAIIEGMEHLI